MEKEGATQTESSREPRDPFESLLNQSEHAQGEIPQGWAANNFWGKNNYQRPIKWIISSLPRDGGPHQPEQRRHQIHEAFSRETPEQAHISSGNNLALEYRILKTALTKLQNKLWKDQTDMQLTIYCQNKSNTLKKHTTKSSTPKCKSQCSVINQKLLDKKRSGKIGPVTKSVSKD